MSGLFDLLAGLLAFFYSLIPSYAFAIVMLTITVMLALTPFTLRGTRSMLAIQRLQPEMKKLQEKHKNDRQAMNEAMMAFYKEHKINPLSGCLPMLLQMPVLIVMYNVIRGLTHKGGPKYVSEDTELYRALRESGGEMVTFGIDLAKTANKAAGSDAIGLYLLIALVVVTGFWQIRQTSARQAKNPNQPDMNPQMKMMSRIFPLFSGLISLSLPGGVVLYFLTSNLFRIAQQGLMYRFDPVLKQTMRDVSQIDAKATEIEREHKQHPKAIDAPATPRPDRGRWGRPRDAEPSGNGASNGAQATKPAKSPPPTGRITPSGGGSRSNNRSKKKRSRRGR
jgi:YidC/Oxa1 family membrane protein insertase